MMEFRLFIEQSESYMTDVRKTLRKLPKKHRALIRGYKFKFEPDNTLKNDSEHIGFIDEEKKVIRIASPWNYGREYTLLHEIGHAVWKYVMNEKLKKKWGKIVKTTKDKQNQGIEELFSMAYANCYAKNKIEIHSHKKWEKFILALPQ